MAKTDPAIRAATLPNPGEGAIPRNQVVQSVLDLYRDPHYLEIGVYRGKTFNAVRAARKVAVDPEFRFDHEAIAVEQPETAFHPMTSDDYFGTVADPAAPFDVIYLDGMHTVEQTLRDLINAFAFLKPGGVILVDDVFPSSFAASLPDRRAFRVVRRGTRLESQAWMGDVYRLVFFVESFCQQYSYRTVNDNHGQLILWRSPRKSTGLQTLAEVGAIPYQDIFLKKAAFNFAPLAAIITDLKRRGNHSD